MKFVAFLLFTTAAEAFMGTSVPRSHRSTQLRMVAEDAKVILVTGSSRGLGKSIALDLGKHGQKVVINYVSDGSKEAADATVSEIKELGGDAVAIKADSESRIKSLFGYLPFFFNCSV